MWAANYKAPCGIDMDFHLIMLQFFRDDLLDYKIGDIGPDLLGRDVGSMLGRNDNRFNADRFVIFIPD